MNVSVKPRILGYVMARNEWPLLGLSVMHAINSGIDRVAIVDHCSDDATREGLQALQSFWSDKIVVYRVDDSRFLQQATSSLVMALENADSFDWVYVFDADEFVLLPLEMTLEELLSRVSPDVDAVRYELDQWVTPTDFNDLDVTEYLRIRYRAVAKSFTEVVSEDSDEIEHGSLNFFDLPFLSKVIVRGKWAHALHAGAHRIGEEIGIVEMTMDTSTLRVGHVPLTSRRRLALKSEHGAALISGGFGPSHGWQNQMIYRLQTAGTLEDFWQNHSVTDDMSYQLNNSFPVTAVDESLAQAINKVITQFSDLGSKASENSHNLVSSGLSIGNVWSGAISSIDRQIRNRIKLGVERDALLVERDALVVERDALVVERDALVVERDALVTGSVLEIEWLRDRYKAVESALDEHRQAITRFTSSKSFRLGMFITWPARYLYSAIAALKRRI